MALGKRNRIRKVGPAERLDEQEPQCRCLSFDGARRELPIAEQMNLVLANVVRPQPIRRPAKIPGELLDRMDIGPYGVRRVVATLELIQHHLAKMGHSEPPCDTHLSLNYRQNPPMLQHPPRQRLRSNALLVTWPYSRLSGQVGLFFFSWRYQDDARRIYLWASSRFRSLVGDPEFTLFPSSVQSLSGG